MKKSYSKIRHTEEANQALERRFLSESYKSMSRVIRERDDEDINREMDDSSPKDESNMMGDEPRKIAKAGELGLFEVNSTEDMIKFLENNGTSLDSIKIPEDIDVTNFILNMSGHNSRTKKHIIGANDLIFIDKNSGKAYTGMGRTVVDMEQGWLTPYPMGYSMNSMFTIYYEVILLELVIPEIKDLPAYNEVKVSDSIRRELKRH